MATKLIELPFRSAGIDADFSRMSICASCRAIKGRFPDDRLPSGGARYHQECRCVRDSARRQARWPGFDFNTAVELCHCCGLELLPSGSRWSVWFCHHCKTNVCAFNGHHGAYLIPIGRHSLHGVGVRLNGKSDRAAVTEFVRRWRNTVDSMKCLSVWAREIVAENIRSVGLDAGADVSLPDYLSAVQRSKLAKDEVFAAMYRFMENDRTER